jgi:hypothetical protein
MHMGMFMLRQTFGEENMQPASLVESLCWHFGNPMLRLPAGPLIWACQLYVGPWLGKFFGAGLKARGAQ